MQIPTTKTEIAKMTVQMIVAAKASSLVEHQITERTELDEDNIVVNVGSWAAGHLIAQKAKPYTDKIVDTTISKFQSWKNRKNITAE